MSIKKPLIFFAAAIVALVPLVAFIAGCNDKGTGPTNKPIYTLNVNRAPTAGGTVNPASKSNIIPGSAVDIKATPNSGYEFVGWTTSSGYAAFANANSASTKVTLSANVTSSEVVTVYANFQVIFTGSKFTVSFDANGGSPAAISPVAVDSGKTLGSAFPSVTKAGYRFAGWFDGAARYMSSTPITKDVTLTAEWAEPAGGAFTDSRDGQTYSVVTIGDQTWMAENLNYETDNSVCYNNADSNCVKYGRLYAHDAAMGACPGGWHLPAANEWDALAQAAGGSSAAGKKLKSVTWDGTDDYEFSAMPGGNRLPSSGFQFERAGSYAYWWSATEYNGANAYHRYLQSGDDAVRAGNASKGYGLSVRCVLDDASAGATRFTVSFDANGGSPAAISPVTVDSGKTLGSSLPAAQRSGHRFDGWFDGNTPYTASTPITKDVALAAKWTEVVVKAFTVTFNTNGGTPAAIEPIAVDSGNVMGEDFPAVARAGYTFDGWYDGNAAYTAATRITKDVLLAARWTIKRFTLSFNSNGGTPVNINSITVDSGMTTALPAVTRAAHTFGGWFDGATQYTAGTAITKSVALTAKWTPVAGGTFVDSRGGGQTYKWVEIGTQTWMAENLNYEMADSSWCYDNDPINCGIYGRLYTWNRAKTACPTGWHLPTRAEWTILIDYVGSASVASIKLRSTSGWSTKGTDDYGFTALPGGRRGTDGIFGYFSESMWWSATEYTTTQAYYRNLYSGFLGDAFAEDYYTKSFGYSVRCLKD